MNNDGRGILAVIGRILLAAMFLTAGVGKITGFGGTVGYIASAGVPAATIAAMLTIILEIGGSIALIAGFQARLAALLLAAFTLLVTFIFHGWWSLPADQQMVEQLLFFKNIGVGGGVLVVAAPRGGGVGCCGRGPRLKNR